MTFEMYLLKESFKGVIDPRRAQAKQFDLIHLLLYSVLAVASGANSYRKIHLFIHTHWQRLNLVFGSRWRKAPAYTTIRDCLHGLDASQVSEAMRQHALKLQAILSCSAARDGELPEPVEPGALIAMDGKSLRGSLDHFEDRKAAQVLSAFLVDAQLVLGHLIFEDQDQDHEIQAAQRLIQALGLSGHLYTLDALHCQKNSRNSA